MTSGTQPHDAATFQLGSLALHQVDNDGLLDANVVSSTLPFKIYMDFGGTGRFWRGFVRSSEKFTVTYYAEGKGGVPDVTLGKISKDLGILGGNPNRLVTTPDTDIMATISTPGLYELSATVTFDNYPGVAGFVEGPIIEVISE